MIALNRFHERRLQRAPAALIRPLPAILHAHIELIGQESRQVRRGKGLELSIIVRLDGIHVVVRHLAGGVHWHLFKGDAARAVNVEVERQLSDIN